jgi:hypothetical protein
LAGTRDAILDEAKGRIMRGCSDGPPPACHGCGWRPVWAAFGDSGEDLPMLRLAARPVAVAPDKALRAEAEAAGWDIVLETAPAERKP